MADLNDGLWFQSAVSGLYYREHDAAGDVMCVILNGVHYYPKFSNRQPKDTPDRCYICGAKKGEQHKAICSRGVGIYNG